MRSWPLFTVVWSINRVCTEKARSDQENQLSASWSRPDRFVTASLTRHIQTQDSCQISLEQSEPMRKRQQRLLLQQQRQHPVSCCLSSWGHVAVARMKWLQTQQWLKNVSVEFGQAGWVKCPSRCFINTKFPVKQGRRLFWFPWRVLKAKVPPIICEEKNEELKKKKI